MGDLFESKLVCKVRLYVPPNTRLKLIRSISTKRASFPGIKSKGSCRTCWIWYSTIIWGTMIEANGMSGSIVSTWKESNSPVQSSMWAWCWTKKSQFLHCLGVKRFHRPRIQSNKVPMTPWPVGTFKSQRRNTRSIASAE